MNYPDFFKLGTTDDNHAFDIENCNKRMGPTCLFSSYVPVILGVFELFFKCQWSVNVSHTRDQ